MKRAFKPGGLLLMTAAAFSVSRRELACPCVPRYSGIVVRRSDYEPIALMKRSNRDFGELIARATAAATTVEDFVEFPKGFAERR
jgi:hypothetical protein